MPSEKIVSFRDLDTWQAAMDLAVAAHEAASRLPATQRFELGSQIRRSATSVPSNVAEGHAHRGNRTFLRHVRIALGSLAELDTQLELSRRQSLLTDLEVAPLIDAIARTGKLLHGLERALKRRFYQGLATTTGVMITTVWLASITLL